MEELQIQKAPIQRDFHKKRPGNGAKSLRDGVVAGLLTPEDEGLITDFIQAYRATHRITTKRIEQYFDKLKHWRKLIGPYPKNTIRDLYDGIARLDEYRYRGKLFKQNTKRDYIIILKIFYRWLIQQGISSISVEDIEGIKSPAWDTDTVSAGDIPTESEIIRLLRACTSSRDRAMFAMMYEGAFRPGEIAAMKWKDVEVRSGRIYVNVKFKTKYSRTIVLVSSLHYLQEWRNNYPFDPSGDNSVFVTRNGFYLSDAVVNKALRVITERAGVKKHLTPKIFRHASITHAKKRGVDSEALKEKGWGNRNTKMLKVYDHVGIEAAEQWADRLAGVVRQDADPSPGVTAKQCLHCLGVNTPTDTYCRQCGEFLEDHVMEHVDVGPEMSGEPSIKGSAEQYRISPLREGRSKRGNGRSFTVNIMTRSARRSEANARS